MIHHFRRLFISIFLTLLSLLLLFSAAFVYLIATPAGGKWLVHLFKQQFVAVGLMHVGRYEGTLQDGFVLKDITIKGLSYLPDALLRIQQVRVHLPLWDLPHCDFNIFNARIFIDNSEPLVFTGDVYAGKIKGSVYGRYVDLHTVSRFWATEDIKKNLQGYVSNIDGTLQGPVFAPHLSGSFVLESISFKGITLDNGVSEANLVLLPTPSSLSVEGEIIMHQASVVVMKRHLQLLPSKAVFRGDIFNPLVDIHLGGKVEDMEINLNIKGLANSVQVNVSSDPPMLPQDALRVLFTGNAWSASTSPFNWSSSPQVAQNYLSNSPMDENQDMGLMTKLTDNLKLGAEMDQMATMPGATNVYYSRRINGEMDMNEHMSLNVSQQVSADDSYPAYDYGEAEPNTEVYLQYKKRF